MSDRRRTARREETAAPWPVLVVFSVLAHLGLAGGLFALGPSAEDQRQRAERIELTQRQLPPKKRIEPKKPPVKKLEPEKPDKPIVRPRAVRRPVIPPPKVPPVEPPKTDRPVVTDEPPTGPKIFGLPEMQGTARAAPGEGVQVPKGDSLRVDPRIRKRGPPSKGFKKDYQQGEQAPVAVITTKPRPLKKVQPVYPQRLQDLGIEGRVVLELTIDANGRVVAVRVLRGLHPELDQAAIAAAKQMLFSPAKVNGTAVKVPTRYSFVFVLD